MTVSPIFPALGVAPPVYLRLLNSPADWGDGNDPIEERVRHAVEAGFLKRHHSPFSFYLARSEDDLRRIIMAFNGNRHDPYDKLDLVAFTCEEMAAAGLIVQPTPGRTRCGFANRRHHDGEATRDELAALCREAMAGGRSACRINKQRSKEVVLAAQGEQCAAAPAITSPCWVAECAAAPAAES